MFYICTNHVILLGLKVTFGYGKLGSIIYPKRTLEIGDFTLL